MGYFQNRMEIFSIKNGLFFIKKWPISNTNGSFSIKNWTIYNKAFAIENGSFAIKNGSINVSDDFIIFELVPSIKSFRFHNIYGSSKFSFLFSFTNFFFENCYFSDYLSRMSFDFFRWILIFAYLALMLISKMIVSKSKNRFRSAAVRSRSRLRK